MSIERLADVRGDGVARAPEDELRAFAGRLGPCRDRGGWRRW